MFVYILIGAHIVPLKHGGGEGGQKFSYSVMVGRGGGVQRGVFLPIDFAKPDIILICIYSTC